jgi:GT2 family glycosyltransferase
VTVYHQGGATLDRSSPNKLYLNIRNSLSMIYKNVSGLSFVGVFLVKLLVELVAAVDYLIKGKKKFSLAILKAYRDFFKTKDFLKVTKNETEPEVLGSGPVRFIFWNYFVLGKRKFDQL